MSHNASIVTRYIGNCQICEGDQKLHVGRMVHHGYQRPGDGFILGDCPGVGHEPYEVSCDLVKSYKSNVSTRLVKLKKHLADLKAGKVTYIAEATYGGYRMSPKMIDRAVGVTELWTWIQTVQNQISHIQSAIAQCERDIERCTRRIDAWALKPIRTVEEEQAKADTEKAARKAERDAAKAVRQAAAAARKAKADALVAKRLAIQEEFEARLVALAATKGDRQHAARAILAELDKTKYRNWLSKWDLRCTDALIALGVAVQEWTCDGGLRPYLRFT